jgi:HK97 family phage major capsid protein
MNAHELRQLKAKAVADARSVVDHADSEKRAMTADESARFDAYMADADRITANIERVEKLEGEERQLETSTGRKTTAQTRTHGDGELRQWLLDGKGEFKFNLNATPETRALGFAPAAGGVLVDQGFVAQLETAMRQFGGMREVASIIRTESGNALPFPMTNDTANEGEILPASGAVNELDLVFDVVTLGAYKYSSRMIRVPVELMQDSAIDLGSEIGARLGERIGRITNRHFTVGTGVAQPTGLVTAAPVPAIVNGVAISYESMLDLVHSVDPAYRSGATFMFNDATLKALRVLRDGNGELIWQAGMAPGHPDTILGFSYVVNQHVPSAVAGSKCVVFGDLKKYKIRDVLGISLMKLTERYATNHEVAFLGISRHDGALLDAGTNPVQALRR